MKNGRKQCGFSLTEVLLAVGTIAVGLVFIAGVFPAGIYLTTVATEQSIAAIVADEAFAKIKIYAVGDPNVSSDNIVFSELKNTELTEFSDTLFPAIRDCNVGDNEFVYPSAGGNNNSKQYCWSALFRHAADPNIVQVTVFVCRKPSPNLKYHDPNDSTGTGTVVDWPKPVKVGVSWGAKKNELQITTIKTYINDGYTIIDEEAGQLYRVLKRYATAPYDTILLDRNWEGRASSNVWVVPPPVKGGRYPCIAIYQKVIGF